MPTYGSLTPAAERALYERDRAAWCDYVAPWWSEQLAAGGETSINELWPKASAGLRFAIWALCPPALRQQIRRARGRSDTPQDQHEPPSPQPSLF